MALQDSLADLFLLMCLKKWFITSCSSSSFWPALLHLKCQSLQSFLFSSFGLGVSLLKDAFFLLETCDEPCWCPFALLKYFLIGGGYGFCAFHVVVVKQLWCCQSDFISCSCLLELRFNKLSPFYVVTLFEVKHNSSRFLDFHCSCRDAQFNCLWPLVHSGSAAVGCRSRWFLLLRSKPKAVAPHAVSLTSRSMEPPLAVTRYFGLCFIVRLLRLHGRFWNLLLYNLDLCLYWSCLVCCWQRCHSLAVPSGPSTHSSWSDQAPDPCHLVRWSFVLICF